MSLDAEQVSIVNEMLGRSLSLQFELGGCDAGGWQATQLLVSTFTTLDEAVVKFTGPYRNATRLVLLKHGTVVAIAVVLVHEEHRIVQVPLFAAAKTQRRPMIWVT